MNGRIKPPEDATIGVNLSGESLSNKKKTLLSKGLSFCSMPTQLDENQLLEDLESFFRGLRLREYFLDLEDPDVNDERNILRTPSVWMPPEGRDAVPKACVKGVRQETL